MKKPIYVLPLLALVGLTLAIVASIYSNQATKADSQGMLSFQPPFASYIAGTGIVESTTGNIAIGTPVSGVVMEIYVKVGDQVKAGDALFKIDDRDLQAQLVTATARVKEAETALLKPTHRYANAIRLKKTNPNAISTQDFSDLHDDAVHADAVLTLAKAQVTQLQQQIALHTVRAPIAGQILQLKMRLGMYIEGSSVSPSLLMLGGDDRLYLRANIDEQDVWRFHSRNNAITFVRGHPELKLPLRYEYTEPFMIPKPALTGVSTERTDTRVLEVLYSFGHPDFPVYVGQLLDVYIETPTSQHPGDKS